VVDSPELEQSGSGGGSGSGTSRISLPFVLYGEGLTFAPKFFPDRIQVDKQRNLDRQQDFCGDEDVTDTGAKNREVHVSGRLIGYELDVFDVVGDLGETMDMSSSTWSGKVYVKNAEYEGPTGYYPPREALIWEYSLDLVAANE
jgi:hypothetical protein